MKTSIGRANVENPELIGLRLVSPCALALGSFLLFLIAWCFPPRLYEEIMREPDLMFLDPASLLLYLLCILAFAAGALIFARIYPCTFVRPPRLDSRLPALVFCLLPLGLCLLFEAASVTKLLSEHPDIGYYLMTQQGDYAKAESGTEGFWAFAPAVLTVVAWWVFWRSRQLALAAWKRRLLAALVFLSILIASANAVLKVNRTDLLSVVIGSGVLFAVWRAAQGKLTSRKVWGFALLVLAVAVALAMALAALRGAADAAYFLYHTVGYSIASFNRLAALLRGQLRYPFGGHGVYCFPFFAFNGTLNSILHHRALFDFPELQDVWQSEFGAVNQAGLDGSMIWATAFGYVFADIGWAAPIYFLGIGAFYGWAWSQIRKGSVVGIAVYPLLAFCVVFWFGINYVLDSKTFVFLGIAPLLHFYERLFLRAA